MSIIKRAFIQGLQRSLVTSGAIPPYSSIYQQKHALGQAEKKLKDKEDMEGEEREEAGGGEKKELVRADLILSSASRAARCLSSSCSYIF